MARAVDDRSNGSSASGSRKGLSGTRAADLAQRHLEELTGKPVESVSGLSRLPDGWTVTLELVELERVPPTTDILASYRVELDRDGDLMGYERVSRYYRNQAEGSGA